MQCPYQYLFVRSLWIELQHPRFPPKYVNITKRRISFTRLYPLSAVYDSLVSHPAKRSVNAPEHSRNIELIVTPGRGCVSLEVLPVFFLLVRTRLVRILKAGPVDANDCREVWIFIRSLCDRINVCTALQIAKR